MRLALFIALVATSVTYGAVGDAWLTRNANPSSASLHGITWNGSAFVAAGKYGTALTSTDGITWASGTTGTLADLNAVASNGTITVMAGEDGTILSSANGSAWTARRGPAIAHWRAATWTGSRFVLAGDAGSIATSTDGITWVFRYTGTMSDLRTLVVRGSLVVAGGTNGVIVTSLDGVTWISQSSGTTAAVRSLASDGTRFVAAGDNGVVLTSTDAVIWSLITTGITTGLNSVFWTGTQFIASGIDGSCIASADGASWTLQSTGTGAEFLAGTFANGTAVMLGENGIIFTSPTGSVWIARSSGARENLKALARTSSVWAAAGDGGRVVTSATGTGWNSQLTNVTANLHGMAWNGTKLVAVGDGGVVISSSDGVTWVTAPAITTRSLRAVASSASQWVAVGEAGVMISSSNGTSWSSVASVSSSTWRAVTWSGTQFVAVGDSGAIATSSSGTSWSFRTSGVTTPLMSVSWGGTLFVTVGVHGTVLTSTNGSSWTRVFPPLADAALVTFRRVLWNGVEFVAVGENGSPMDPAGWVMTSFDGNTWVQRMIEAAPPLASLAAASGEVFAVGEAGAILKNVPAPLPDLALQVDQSTFAESAGLVGVRVVLSAPSLVPIKVNFNTIGSTALLGATSDATLVASPVTIAPGQLTADINVTLRDDTLDESDETIVINLTTPSGAILGFPRVHTLTITDNDTAPSFVTHPASRIVAAGASLTMTGLVTGDAPLTYQWTKTNTNISGAVASNYLIPGALLTSGGTYRLKATNKSATVTSDPAELVVVDTTAKAFNIVYKNSVTFTVGTSGNNLTYQWKKDGGVVTDDTTIAKRLVGSTTKTLVIKNLAATDSGVYRCLVTSPVGSLDGGANTLTVIIPPVVTPPVFPTLMVSQALNFQVAALNAPTKFTITGLPSGLTYNSSTGLITGRPLVVSGVLPFTITITASNASGTSTPPTTMPLTVVPLTSGISGNYSGLIQREVNVNANLGGRIGLAISKTGVVTGSILSGKTSHSFIKALDTSNAGNPTLTTAIKRTGKSDLVVDLTLDPTLGIVSPGTLQDTTGTASFQAWKNMATPFTGYPGRYTTAIKLTNGTDVGIEGIPQGHGYAAFSISTTGNGSGTLRVADGTQFTFSTPLRNVGTLAIYAPLYTAPGSVKGLLNVTPGSPTLVSSTELTWFKPPQTSGRSYRLGFGPLDLTAFGAAYTAPASGSIALGLTSTADNVSNAALNFAEGGAPDPTTRLNIAFRLTSPNVRDPQTPATNPGKVTVGINHLTGSFNGGFSLTDTDVTVLPNKPLTRSALYYGLIVRDPADGVLKGYGHFQLPMMPQNLVLPATTSATSPILSGSVMLEHAQ